MKIVENDFPHLSPWKWKKNDVDKMITQMVIREEAHIALMELMK